MRKINLKSIVWKEGKHYIARCLDAEVSSFGKSKKDALVMLQEALELYFEDTAVPKKSERVNSPTIASVAFQHA